MSDIHLEISQIKNIKYAKVTLPFTEGLYALVGENACGKSTLMLALSLMVKTSSAHLLTESDINKDSYIDIQVEQANDHWYYKNKKLTTGKFGPVSNYKGSKRHNALIASTHVEGFYEGSIFYGCRFDDYNLIDEFMADPNMKDYLVTADVFVSESLGFILHNNKQFYHSLKKIKSRETAKQKGFKGIPYFMEINGHIISQYRMSSGESMLISLVDFINNLVIKNYHLKTRKKLLFLIDEVELALHPAAIDRLVDFLRNLVRETEAELVIYFSTHSAELIHRIDSKNIFLIENDEGAMEITNPCYPNYAVRNLYVPNGFDFLLLVEDELSKTLVEKIIRDNNLAKSKLCCVLPAGGCTQMLRLHHDMLTYNTLGVGKHIISIYDGDVKTSIASKDEYKYLKKCFLPIASIEKYLKSKLIDIKDKKFTKLISDKYFHKRALPDIISDYKNDPRTKKHPDNDGKNLYRIICSNLESSGITEERFINYLCEDICDYEDLSKFIHTLTSLLT